MRKLLLILAVALASCEKPSCPTPQITGFTGDVLYWSPKENVTIEVVGIDGPYKGFIQASGGSQRVDGAKLKVRIKSGCSDWSEWVYKQ